MVRRALIVLLSLGWSAGVLLFLGNGILPESEAARPATATGVIAEGAEQLPCMVANTGLCALQLGLYEGRFPEDGSDRPVADTAALLVKNISACAVERGAVMLTAGEEVLVFEVFALPPGQTALVMEAGRKPYTTQTVTACDGWAVQTQWDSFEGILSVQEVGLDTLALTNVTDKTLHSVRLLYKSFDEASGIYIGGICHTAYIDGLQPGEQVCITPYRYVSGYSRVVAVTWE